MVTLRCYELCQHVIAGIHVNVATDVLLKNGMHSKDQHALVFWAILMIASWLKHKYESTPHTQLRFHD